MHKPVLAKDIIYYLNPENKDIIIDATVGTGAHARLILDKISPHGSLIGIDRDGETLKEAEKNLSSYNSSLYKLVKRNFSEIDAVLTDLNIERVDGILFDLGISSFQLDDGARGFSITKSGALDMRADRREQALNAAQIIARYREDDLREIIKTFGEERYARRIAAAIVKEREKKPIRTTGDLAEIILKAVGGKYKRQKIHPATRTFQALRIEVNRELDAVREALEKLPGIMNKGARACVISFHSLEDRIVKNSFKKFAKEGICKIMTKKPITPGDEELRDNPRSRSAKLRVAEF